MPRLVIVRGPAKGTSYELGDLATIGRASTNTIQLRIKRVSREHARIERRGNQYVAVDLGSRNGIYINGRRSTDRVLKPGDHVLIGTVLMVYDPPEDADTLEDDVGPAIVYSEDASAATASLDTVLSLAASEDGADVPALDDLVEANRKLKALYDVSDAIYSVLDLDQLLKRILSVVLRILPADRGVILLYDDVGSALKPVAVRRRKGASAEADMALRDLPVSRTVLDQVVRERKAVLTADAMVDPRFDGSDSVSIQNIRSMLCVPLLSRKTCFGVLYLDTCRPTHQFVEEDLRLLTTVARQAATAIANARSHGALRRETRELRFRISEKFVIVGSSPQLKAVLDQTQRVAASGSTVLITGETGTGKELIARAIHEESPRSRAPFICINCAAVPDTLLDSELFGHERGAFTGAHKTRHGLFARANRGTLFLDEVGEVPLALQSKLLRVVESKCFERVGGSRTIQTDVRLIAATNQDLKQLVADGRFRQDLYYRLAVVPLHVPPLRGRTGDIPELAGHFVKRYVKETGKRIEGITDEAMSALSTYPWPGNVRELQNVIERAVILTHGDIIELDDLPDGVASVPSRLDAEYTVSSRGNLRLAAAVSGLERHIIARALAKANGKKIEAARILDISRPTLDKKMKEYGLNTRSQPGD